MRILQVVADGTPGGGTTNVLALSEDLIERGVQVAFCTQQNSYASEHAASLGAQVVGDIDFFKGRLDRQAAAKLGDVVRNAKADIVHLHGGRAAFFYARSGTCKLGLSAYTVRGYHFLRKPFWQRQLAAMAERRSSRCIDQTVLVCHYDQRLAASYRLLPAGKQGVVIHNGIRISDIPLQSPTADMRRIAVLGRLTLQKDPHLVLDIARRMQPSGFHFDLIGGGDLEKEIRSRITDQQIDNVTVHGSLPREQALATMQQCGQFLLASRWEGLPIAPVEAMQMGLGVVVSDVSGNGEVVDNGATGFVVKQDDIEGYETALQFLANDPAQRDAMIEAGRTKVASHFTRQRVVRQYYQMYEDLLKHGHGR
ncbi:GDP-mannose:cellobiosyl-diphosphopolyprenol alpha-mannosyltransferase [Roseimaritima multifibrata]|uniref:GDP-mannose:cellobiosyl-diphosphopolyprenol alpha-mannosyltransferase n=1 Tax=Roseimaritima multifibrata TaxID=1930274 RepID=A0A517MJV4_9BACT|nr:glycosyltransferase family 4 protein [Roseimaritima multifibrata]QDS95148.1 GDP-mannose:cellobiosyl-diphosphopolyprenol alpha-mannosyltransferase [Roseimaritima multifibrata]